MKYIPIPYYIVYPVQFIANWVIILTAPIWVWPVLAYGFTQSSDSKAVLTGKKFAWRKDV